jgi:hypothetical protein
MARVVLGGCAGSHTILMVVISLLGMESHFRLKVLRSTARAFDVDKYGRLGLTTGPREGWHVVHGQLELSIP